MDCGEGVSGWVRRQLEFDTCVIVRLAQGFTAFPRAKLTLPMRQYRCATMQRGRPSVIGVVSHHFGITVATNTTLAWIDFEYGHDDQHTTTGLSSAYQTDHYADGAGIVGAVSYQLPDLSRSGRFGVVSAPSLYANAVFRHADSAQRAGGGDGAIHSAGGPACAQREI